MAYRKNPFKTADEAMEFLHSLSAKPVNDTPISFASIKLRADMSSKDIIDHVENYPYKVVDIPQVSTTRSDYEMSPHSGGTVKIPFGYEVGQGNFTIKWMIESFTKKIPFTIANWEDLVEVASKLAAYAKVIDADVTRLNSRRSTVDEEEMLQIESYYHAVVTFSDYLTPLAERIYHFNSKKENTLKISKLERVLTTVENNRKGKDPLEGMEYLKGSAARVKRLKTK